MLTESNRIEQKDKKFDADVSGESFMNHLFVRLVAKGKKFTNVDFKYTIFDTCYLRDCNFDSCDFTGCRFVGTNLYESSFAGCKFDYSTFEKTLVDNDILDTGCPGHENLKYRFARTLRVNYQQLGDTKSANKAVNVELQATEVYLHKAWQSNESYYRKKYRGWGRIKVFLDWIGFKVLDLLWGNGESVLKLLRAVIVVLLLMFLIDAVILRNQEQTNGFLQALIEAPQVFFGVLSPTYYPGLYLTAIVFIRLALFGFFMSIIIKRFNRR
jgi:hypothetical protein